MASKSFLAPPTLEPEKYSSWKKEMKFWEMATPLEKTKRGATVFLSLTGKAREAILEMNPDDLEKDDGMTTLYAELDKLFKVDTNQATFAAYEKFESYKRADSVSITDFQIEFERLVAQLKEYKIVLPEAVLAFRAIKSANIGENEKLVIATVKNINLNDMMLQIKKIMGVSANLHSTRPQLPHIKLENTEVNLSYPQESYDDRSTCSDEVFYNYNYQTRGNNRGRKPWRGNPSNRGFNSYRGSRPYRGGNSQKTFNPPGFGGRPSKCAICESTMHWAKDCQHADNRKKDADEESVYWSRRNKVDEADGDHDDDIQDVHVILMSHTEQDRTPLLSQTIGCALLDTGCSKTVCGRLWYNCYLDTLTDDVRRSLTEEDSATSFKFGNGSRLPSQFRVTLPCVIAGKSVSIVTDVVDSEIPLLLSKSAMKKAKTNLNLDDTVTMFGKQLPLKCTDSGHYLIDLPSRKCSKKSEIVLFTNSLSNKTNEEKRKIANKLHKQFSHPSHEKMVSLVKDAGVKDASFFATMKEVSDRCNICQRYKRAEPRPVVAFSLASRFNQTVSMDIKEIHGTKVLHLNDHFSRYSVAVKINSKEASEIVRNVFKHWIAYFGTPTNFLTDNGREFNNEVFRDMAQNLNITVRTTAAQSPWSNGLNERHNGILGEMTVKTVEDSGCPFETALAWAVSSKNCLQNVHGFSPNQLVFGSNPNLPNILVDEAPALEGVCQSEVVASNLNALHNSRRAFIQSESSEKLRRALRHQIRPSIGASYNNGDKVFFKRNESNRWLGPGYVIGTENKQVLVKNGGVYVRVHPCRIKLCLDPLDLELSDDGGSAQETRLEQPIPLQTSQHTSETHAAESTDNGFIDEEFVEDRNESSLSTEQDAGQIHKRRGRPRKEAAAPANVVDVPKVGEDILCKLNSDDGDWTPLKVHSRAGKATGANKYIMNVCKGDENPFWLDFQKGVLEWKHASTETHDVETSDESIEENVLLTNFDNVLEAKQQELQNWILNKVYSVVPDNGQDTLGTRWVLTEKPGAEGNVLKARLVAKGYQDKEDCVRRDSPTCSKESLKIILAIIASNGWECNSMDVKTAFLQSNNFNRLVYLSPPPEAEVPIGHIWKLNKCVYGLNDASRHWYLTVRSILVKLGVSVSKYDQAIFTWHYQGKLQGVICSHVDNFCWAGTESFQRLVIAKVREAFNIKSEESRKFKYLGLDIDQNSSGIRVSQNTYVRSSLELLEKRPSYSSDSILTDEELSSCRSAIGKLNWLSTQTRPDISFDVSDLQSSLRDRSFDNICQINKAIRKTMASSCRLQIPDLGRASRLSLQIYCDASFASKEKIYSQGGHIIFLTGENGFYTPIWWQSQRIKRVVKSTQAAETMAMVDALEAGIYYREFLLEILRLPDVDENLPITCKTDNSSLNDSIHSNTQILDKRLRIETAIIRELLETGKVKNIEWIPTSVQLADCLTKKGIPSFKILDHMGEARKPLP